MNSVLMLYVEITRDGILLTKQSPGPILGYY